MKTPYESLYKKYTYKDNSKTGKHKPVFVCAEHSIEVADMKFNLIMGYDVKGVKHIGCSVEVIGE